MMNTTTKNESPPMNGAQPATAPTSTAMVIGSDAYRSALEPTKPIEALDFATMMASQNSWGSVPEILGKIALGRVLGLPWMVSLQKIHLIKSTYAVAADTLQALCLRATAICEYFEPVLAECDAERATFVTKRVGRPEQRYVYTIEDAEQMGVVDRGKDDKAKTDNNWNKVRKQMLLARCKSILARLIYPDLTQGLYCTEELSGAGGFDPSEIAGEVLSPTEAAATTADRVVVVQSAKRDYAAEAEALKAKIRQAGTSRAAAAEVREAIAAWDGIEPFKAQVAAVYNEVREERKKAAATAGATTGEAAPSGTVANPAPVPEGGLFANDAAKGDGK